MGLADLPTIPPGYVPRVDKIVEKLKRKEVKFEDFWETLAEQEGKLNLKDSISEKKEKIEYYDLAELVLESLEGDQK